MDKLQAWHMLRLCGHGVLTQRLEGIVLKVRTPVLWLQGAEHGGQGTQSASRSTPAHHCIHE